MRGLAILAISVVMGVAVIGLVAMTLTSGGSSVQQPWQVIKNNVTVTGPIATTVVCGVFAASCVPECCTIDNNQLINYQGNFYYVRVVTLGTDYGPATTSTSTEAGRVVTTITAGQPQSTLAVTIWFTNSTVYCISPAFGPEGNNWGVSAPTCPQ